MILGVTWGACEAQLKLIAEHSKQVELAASPAHETLLAFGLVDDGGLTPLGEAYHFARFVLQDSDELERVLAEMLKALPEVNALCDALWGKGEVPVQGAVSLIRRTMKTSDDHVAKRWLEMLSKAGLITYNRNRPTLRAAYNPSELAPPGEAAPEIARSHLLSPDTRFSNLLALRDMLRAASGIVRWYETHFDGKVLEVIARGRLTTGTSRVSLTSA